jgi:serine/threonine protein phosphatase PrpC
VNDHGDIDPCKFVCGQGQTHRGVRRPDNQDALLVLESPDIRLYAVADGMGGARGGARASQIAVSTLEEAARSAAGRWSDHTLGEIFFTVDRRIREEASRNTEIAEMGTTLVGLAFRGTRAYLANVGDSRAYLLRGGKLSRLTRDHTVVEELISAGTLQEEQAHCSPISHVLTQVLGSHGRVSVDCWVTKDGPSQGDKFLLCSDGLHSQLSEPEIQEICSAHPAQEAVEILIRRANELGGGDNVSVVVVDLLAGYPQSGAAADSNLEWKKVAIIERGSGVTQGVHAPGGNAVPAVIPPMTERLSTIPMGPIQAVALFCIIFLLGLLIGSNGIFLTAPKSAELAQQKEALTGRASLGRNNAAARRQSARTLGEIGQEAALRHPELKALLQRYQAARERYLSSAQTLLTGPPNAVREQAVIDLLNEYESATAALQDKLQALNVKTLANK